MASSRADAPTAKLRPARVSEDSTAPEGSSVVSSTGRSVFRLTVIRDHQAGRKLFVETLAEWGRFRTVVRLAFYTTPIYESLSIDAREEAMEWHQFVADQLLIPTSDVSQLCAEEATRVRHRVAEAGAADGPVALADEPVPTLPDPEDGVTMDWSY